MSIIPTILMAIGGLTVMSVCVVAAILLLPSRRPKPPNHPETQNDFAASLARWADVQERKGE